VYAAIWRALLGPTTFSLFITGGSGAGKSELAALAQQHFGPAMDANHFPASWQDTGNAARVLAFYAKDALLVVDDFVPVGNAASQQKLQSEADKLLRAQGNSAGRRRLSADGKLLGTRPPRGLILSTGEDMPRGKSLNARLVMLNFPKDAMKWDTLTVCQRLAAKGEFSKAVSGLVQWLSPRLLTIRQRMYDEKFMRGRQPESCGVHMRTPENLSSLRFGFLTYLEFARDIRAISPDESKALIDRAEAAFREIEIGEAEKHAHNDIARMFLRYVRSAITMGKAHSADPKTGGPPQSEKPWGWRILEGAGNRQSQGSKIGWVKDDQIYLLPDAAYAVAYQLAKDQGEILPGSIETIRRELKDQKLLANR
jgi:hypothetical protein